MTSAGPEPSALLGERYRLGALEGGIHGVGRWRARDEKLDRDVIAWVAESEPEAPTRDALFALARALGRSPHPAFLPVLDVVPEADRLGVVLAAPSTARPVAGTLDGEEAARIALGVGEALEAAVEVGLDPAHLGLDALVEERDGPSGAAVVRLDPVAILAPVRNVEAPARGVLLAGLIDELLGRTRTGDPAADNLAGVTARWRQTGGAEGVAALLDELRALLNEPTEAPPRGAATPNELFEEDEPTELLAPTGGAAATAVVERPAVPRRREAAPRERARPLPQGTPKRPARVGGGPTRAPSAVRRVPRRPRGVLPWRVAIPAMAAVVAVSLAAVAVFTAGTPEAQVAAPPGATAVSTASEAFGPPVVQPAAGQVTVGLAAREDSNVRVTVDDVVEFNGVLAAGETQSWQGNVRIDVWTDKGKTLELAVNGQDLGPYSPAMEHPEWNRIDFSFWPGSGR